MPVLFFLLLLADVEVCCWVVKGLKKAKLAFSSTICMIVFLFVLRCCFLFPAPCFGLFSFMRFFLARDLSCARGSVKWSSCTSLWKDMGASSADANKRTSSFKAELTCERRPAPQAL